MTHGDLVNLILIDLSERGLAWANHTGALKQGTRFIRYGLKGSADILACIDGRFIAVECKVGRDAWRPDQRVFAAAVNRAGGVYLLARSTDGTGDDALTYVRAALPCP